jgi:LysM repeat protein
VFKGQRLLVYVSVKEKAQLSSSVDHKSTPSSKGKSSDNAIAKSGGAKASAAKAKVPASFNTTDGKYTWHIVQKGDTLYSIAKRYEGTVDEIKSLNNLSTNELKPGTKLRVKVSG